MNLTQTKALAEKFRAVADDSAAVKKLADETSANHDTELEVCTLCKRFHSAANGDAVRAIADEVKARTA